MSNSYRPLVTGESMRSKRYETSVAVLKMLALLQRTACLVLRQKNTSSLVELLKWRAMGLRAVCGSGFNAKEMTSIRFYR